MAGFGETNKTTQRKPVILGLSMENYLGDPKMRTEIDKETGPEKPKGKPPVLKSLKGSTSNLDASSGLLAAAPGVLVPPGHHVAIRANGREGPVRGGDGNHLLQLVGEGRSVPAPAPQRSRSGLCGVPCVNRGVLLEEINGFPW